RVDDGVEPDFDALRPCVHEVLEELLAGGDWPLLNVNFPARPQGIRWARQSVRHYRSQISPQKDPMGRQHYWFGVRAVEETEEDTDRWAIAHGYASITPLRLDLTDRAALEAALAKGAQVER